MNHSATNIGDVGPAFNPERIGETMTLKGCVQCRYTVDDYGDGHHGLDCPTRQPRPELGSGALREALERISRGELNTPFMICNCTHDDENCCEKVGEWCPQCIAATALSLSSPIEPQCHELTDADAVECKNCGLGIGYWPSQPECARPTPQASSEIRERLQAILDSHPYEHEIAIEGYVRLQQQIAVVVGALAPSRQGAGGK